MNFKNVFKKEEKQNEWWELDTMYSVCPHASYYMAMGQRSNGKTHAVLAKMLEKFIKSNFKQQGAYIRRNEEDMMGKKGKQLLANHVQYLKKLTRDEWDHFKFSASGPIWYLAKWEEVEVKHRDGEVSTERREKVYPTPFLFGFSINTMESDKGPNYASSEGERITTTLFDEVITRRFYIDGDQEPVLYFNLLSTIIRDRTDVENYLISNTVSQYCPYFDFFGIQPSNIAKMRPGQIDLYTYGESKDNPEGTQHLVLEITPTTSKVEATNAKYFAFDNPRLQMFKGFWEMDNWQLLPQKYEPSEVILNYYIKWNNNIYTAEIIEQEGHKIWTYIHKKTTPLREEEDDIIFSKEASLKENYYQNILRPEVKAKVFELIVQQFNTNSVYFQSLYTGEEINNYLRWCRENR